MSKRYRGWSDSQANAEALARRSSPYTDEHRESAYRRNVRILPSGLDGLLKWFIRPWQHEVPPEFHVDGVETEQPGMIDRGDGTREADPGGGSALGSPKWNHETKQAIFGRPNRLDEDGSYAAPMHWTVTWMERNRHPLKAAVLRLIGRGGDWRSGVRVTCGTCTSAVTLPEEFAESIARDALRVAFNSYQDEPRGGYRAA